LSSLRIDARKQEIEQPHTRLHFNSAPGAIAQVLIILMAAMDSAFLSDFDSAPNGSIQSRDSGLSMDKKACRIIPQAARGWRPG
jgi:hypothetical protein